MTQHVLQEPGDTVCPEAVGPVSGLTKASQSVAHHCYRLIRERIIRGHYPQGSRLSEGRVADELGVSRVPVREAIAELRASGFVSTRPRGGVVVWKWSRERADEVFVIRGVLEPLAARLAARSVREDRTPTTPAHDTMHRTEAALASGDAFELAEAIHDFHRRLVQLSGNELLSTMMDSITERMIWLMFITWQGRVETVTHDHASILGAIESGNEDLAAALAFTHVESARAPSLHLFDNPLPD